MVAAVGLLVRSPGCDTPPSWEAPPAGVAIGTRLGGSGGLIPYNPKATYALTRTAHGGFPEISR